MHPLLNKWPIHNIMCKYKHTHRYTHKHTHTHTHKNTNACVRVCVIHKPEMMECNDEIVSSQQPCQVLTSLDVHVERCIEISDWSDIGITRSSSSDRHNKLWIGVGKSGKLVLVKIHEEELVSGRHVQSLVRKLTVKIAHVLHALLQKPCTTINQ